MRIGLVRHFRVDCSHKFLLTDAEFRDWATVYDCSAIKPEDMAVSMSQWEKCYCSQLMRAVETARYIYSGSIAQSMLLNEVPISPVYPSRIKLPWTLWLLAGRAAWFFSHHSQQETRGQTRDRARQFITDIMTRPETAVLVVTHGFFMLQMQRELTAQGFRGDNFNSAKYGKIYVFSR